MPERGPLDRSFSLAGKNAIAGRRSLELVVKAGVLCASRG
jgi:hypothetical protein